VTGNKPALVVTIEEGGEKKEQILHHDEALKALEVETFSEAETLKGQTVSQDEKSITVQDVIPSNRVIISGEEGENQFLTADDFETIVASGAPQDASEEEAASLKLRNVIGPPQRVNAYGLLVDHVLPPWLAGFFAAVIVGAILSSFNSALNSTATLFSLGVYQHMIRADASEDEVIKSGKWFGWIIAIAAMSSAPLLAGQDSIFGYLQKMNGLYFIPIFSVVLIGIVHRRVPAIAANVALVLGFVVIICGYFVPPFKSWAEQIHGYHFLGAVFATLIVLMLIWGKIQPLDEPWQQQDSGDVDLTPWKPAKIFGLVLVLIVLAFYLRFADFSVVSFP